MRVAGWVVIPKVMQWGVFAFAGFGCESFFFALEAAGALQLCSWAESPPAVAETPLPPQLRKVLY